MGTSEETHKDASEPPTKRTHHNWWRQLVRSGLEYCRRNVSFVKNQVWNIDSKEPPNTRNSQDVKQLLQVSLYFYDVESRYIAIISLMCCIIHWCSQWLMSHHHVLYVTFPDCLLMYKRDKSEQVNHTIFLGGHCLCSMFLCWDSENKSWRNWNWNCDICVLVKRKCQYYNNYKIVFQENFRCRHLEMTVSLVRRYCSLSKMETVWPWRCSITRSVTKTMWRNTTSIREESSEWVILSKSDPRRAVPSLPMAGGRPGLGGPGPTQGRT